MTRQLAKLKPHLWRGPRQWWCLMDGSFVGSGYSARGAYADWVERNGRVR